MVIYIYYVKSITLLMYKVTPTVPVAHLFADSVPSVKLDRSILVSMPNIQSDVDLFTCNGLSGSIGGSLVSIRRSST